MTLGFSLVGRTLAIAGLKNDPQNRLTLDGKTVDFADLTWDGGRASLKLPLQVFDARSHRLIVTPAGEKPETFNHASTYEGALTSAGDRITGWLRDRARPGCPIEIDVDIDGDTVATVMCEGDGPDGDCAFELDNPVPPGETRLLGIRVRGTDYYPLGKYLIRLSALAAGQALDRHLPAGEKRRALDAFNRHFLLGHARSGEAGAFPDHWAFTKPCHGDTVSHGVDVIVPVYRGKAETLTCIDSILTARGDTAYNLIVINDASPESDLVKALKSHAAKHDYTLLHNAENFGFVATVNRGMALNDDNDVVLVNADTEVSDFWLDRLKAAAWSAPSIATATPLSNNATILSLPDRDGGEGLPYGLDLYNLNALLAREAAGVTVDLPTAHGFCMYIRREALRETGLFDAETFGKGYGEENDFSLRAAARGWRNVAACDVFVRHKGSVSFGANGDRIAAALDRLRGLYPDYDGQVRHFIATDPMAAVRNRFQKAQWRDKPLAVFISLATGGGVDTNVNFLAARLQGEGYRVVIARRSLDENYAYTLAEWRAPKDDSKVPALLYPARGGLSALCADILSLQPRFVHVHHLIDLEDGIDRFLVASGIPYYVTLHDYFYLCPRVTLLDDGGEYSEVPDFAACNTCLKRGGAHRDMNPSYDGVWPDIVRWRDKWHDLLKHAVALFAPSKAAAAIYERTFADLPIQVRPHQGPAAPTLSHDRVTAPSKIKVALLGGVGAHKGYNEIIALLRWAEKREPDLSFALIGFSDDVDLIRSFPNLDYMGPYTPDTLESMVKQSGAQVALFMSPWPETYVYTLSEALSLGLTPVSTDLGAPGERLRALKVGELVPPGAPHGDVVKAIRAAATTKITPHTYSEGSYASLIGDYYGLDAIADDRRNHSLLLPGADGLHDDAWATRDVILRFAAANPVNRLKLDFYIPESFGPQQTAVRINGEDYGRIALPADGSARRLDIATRPVCGLVTVELNFSFTHRLAPPDERMGAAKLGAASFEHSEDAPAEQRPAPAAVRLRPSPDLKVEDLPALEDGGTLEDVYRSVTSYALSHQTPGLLGQARRLARDVLWSARIARRKGAKNGLKSFTAMRTLRESAFDEAFYNLQLKGSEREGMDPVNHYVVFGAQEGLDPAPGFSTSFYLKAHDDLARVGINPFFHYLRHGARENRRIEPSSRIGLFLEAHGGRAGDGHRLGLAHTLLLGHGGSGTQGGDWPKKERPADQPKFTLHDLRPNDDILDVAYMGKTFLESHDLLGAKPRWEAAVAEINALPRPAISETPDISVVIPVYGQLAYTLNCLHSLLRQDADHTFEILVGDDASPDASEQWLKQVNNVRYIRHGENAGFIANCNATALAARGKYLVFLNNDTRVADHWLDNLLETFWHFPKAGMVGSKLFYPDGSLQEAGGIVWRDGSAWNYGRNDDPNRPAYSYARAVDYVSGASFMIRRDLWKKLDGFDTRYSPAYYEDTDLAFRLRDLGHSVIMQPLSKVVHYEGKTSGTDTTSGAKAYQTVNKEKFLDRWRDTLKSHRDNGDKPHLERDRQVTKRVLIMDACNPTPSKDAGSKATIDLIRYYQALGYHVSFVPEDNFLFQREEVGRLQAMGVECFYAPYERSVTDLLKTNGPLYDVVQVIRADVGFKNIELIRKLAPQARVIYLNADLHFLRMQRQALVENKPALLEEAEKMKAREMKLAAAVDVTIVHSDVERDILNDEVPDAQVAVLPLIEEIVDADVSHNERRDLVFLGGYNHPPNVDAANFLLDEVWPKLQSKLPDARLLLVGANPPDALKARAGDRVIVTGQVPELGPWFERSRLFLAALRYGAGLKGKVLSAMAHGVPVIATDIAAEGLEVDDGKTIFLANSAEEIVSKAVELYNQPAREWNRHSLHAQDYIQSHHSFQVAHDVMRRVLD